MHVVQLSNAVRQFSLDSGLLILDTSSNRLFAFNETARSIWDLIAEGAVQQELVRRFATFWAIPSARAEIDISAIVAQWCELGLVSKHGVARPELRSSVAPIAEEVEVDRSRPVEDWACTFRGICIEFSVDKYLAQKIRPLFAHFTSSAQHAKARLEVITTSNNEILLIGNGVERIRTTEIGHLIGAVYQAILEQIYPNVMWLAVLHGAAVARRGEAIGLAGPSGSGKTTLAVGLINAGYDYLADDMIALSAPDGTVLSWPLPLSIKPGSIAALSLLHPQLAEAPSYRTKGIDARLLDPPANSWKSEQLRLCRLVFPRFVSGAKPNLEKLSSFDAMLRLIADRMWLGYPITEERVTTFLSWLHSTHCFAITYGDLDEGLGLVESVVESVAA